VEGVAKMLNPYNILGYIHYPIITLCITSFDIFLPYYLAFFIVLMITILLILVINKIDRN
jgi:F0F1-type ATP synthase assembly protein I